MQISAEAVIQKSEKQKPIETRKELAVIDKTDHSILLFIEITGISTKQRLSKEGIIIGKKQNISLLILENATRQS